MYQLINQSRKMPTPEEYKLKYRPSEVEGECLLKEIATLKLNYLKYGVFILTSFLTGGIILLLLHWYPHLKRVFCYDFSTLQQCTHVSVLNYDEELTICHVVISDVQFDEISKKRCRLFINRYLQYFIDEEGIVRAQLFDSKGRLQRITKQNTKGLNESQVTQLRRCFGKGTMQIEKVTWYELLVKELVRPLYLFLFFSTSLWIYDQYYIYTFFVLATALFAIAVTVYQLLSLNQKIYLLAYYQIDMHTLRNGQVMKVSSIDLVPGDIVFLKDPIKLPFEGVIIEGSALINECALTGESVPIVKKADVLENYQQDDRQIDKSAQVFEGTTIIQVNCKKKMTLFQSYREAYGIPVCVTRTNFVTMKGQLIRIILFPKEQENIFQKESGKFLILLFFITVLTFIGMIPQLLKTDSADSVIYSFLMLVTITVPPALPVSMTFGVIYSINKLKEKSIFCIQENKVITGGDVGFCCFDKTGTLTEDFMDFEALIPASKGLFAETIRNRPDHPISVQQALNQKDYLFQVFNNMASNHSIIKIQETGELIGDPMEIKLFCFGHFQINQSNSNPDIIFSYHSKHDQNGQVFRRFQFDSDLQRMSVVAKVILPEREEYLSVYAKGSPEMMLTVMDKSTVPNNYFEILKEYTSNGYRVLAIASKKLQSMNYKDITRQQAEKELLFDGFEIFQNKLKPQTKTAIDQLKEAQVGVVMITGDNALTAANISYQCGIAFRSKGMLIVDYKDGAFHEEDFVYHDRQHQTRAEIIAEIEDERKSRYEPLLNFSRHKSLAKAQIQLVEMSQMPKEHKNRPTSLQKRQYEESYMKKIICLAFQTDSQLCVTGNAFNQLFAGKVEDVSDLKKQFLNCTTVFARTKPNDKAKIVMVYQHTGKTVSMCGDGANDCGALKQADIGLSLSPAEASISAPFTSQVTNISSMVQLLKQCRAGLATNFSLFNIMATYALTQYTTTTICQIYYTRPGQFQYLYWDIACNFFFILLIGYTATANRLSVEKPSNSLFCFSNLFAVLFAFILVVIGQASMVLSLMGIFSSTIDYPSVGGFEVNLALLLETGDRIDNSPQTSILFLFSNFMVLFTLITFNLGAPWRQPIYTNRLFMVLFYIVLTYSILIVMVPATRFSEFYIEYMDDISLRGFILGMGMGFGLVIFILQLYVWQPLFRWLRRKYPEKKWI